MIRHRLSFTIVLATSASACGGSGANQPSEAPALEEWRTVEEWVLASPQRCVTGPFEVDVPATEGEFGRRFTVEVFGARRLPMDTSFAYPDGSRAWGWGWTTDDDAEEHAACRAPGAEEEGSATQGGGGSVQGGETPTRPARGAGRTPAPSPSRGEPEPPSGPPPTLDPYEGTLPEVRRQGSGIAWYPRGTPNVYTLDDIDEQYYEGPARGAFRFQFWFHAPVDTSGVVIRIRDQVLTPRVEMERYRASFDARVAEVDRRLAEAEVVQAEASRDPAVGRVPPPPRAETIPRAPRGDVEWVPGYWRFHAALDDFVWIGGTFVVRAAPEPPSPSPAPATVTATPPPEPAAPPPEPTVTGEAEPAPAVEIAATIPPRPEPRAEVIPPPPNVPGAQWIAGYWELQGVTWRWVAGRWQLPTQSGTRFRPPSIEMRGEVRVYVPGGWFRR